MAKEPRRSVFGDYHVTAIPDTHHVSFRVVRVCARDPATRAPLTYGPAAGEDHADPDAAEAFLEAAVNWEHCSYWRFNQGGDGLRSVHLCGREMVEEVGKLMLDLYRLAEGLVPAWDQGGPAQWVADEGAAR